MDPSIFDTTGLVGTDSYGFSVGPQSDGTYNAPSASLPANQAVDTGTGTQVGNYAPGVFNLLSQGLGAFSSIYQNGQTLDYKRYEATQGGLFAQGQAASTIASAQIAASSSTKMIMILGVLAIIALSIHKG